LFRYSDLNEAAEVRVLLTHLSLERLVPACLGIGGTSRSLSGTPAIQGRPGLDPPFPATIPIGQDDANRARGRCSRDGGGTPGLGYDPPPSAPRVSFD